MLILVVSEEVPSVRLIGPSMSYLALGATVVLPALDSDKADCRDAELQLQIFHPPLSILDTTLKRD
jgi:hypothetical protein